MSATPTTTTYRAPDGQIIRDVQFNAGINRYNWKDDQGRAFLMPAGQFEQLFTPVLESEENSAPPTMVDEWQRVLDEKASQSNLTFGQALEALKRGERVARAGWNGKGMFLFLLPANNGIPTKVITDPGLRKVIETELGGDTFDAYGSIRMFTADKKILTGWLASQTDMLCEDWCILPTA